MHAESHPLADRKVRLNENTSPGVREMDPKPGDVFEVEDWVGHGRVMFPNGLTWVENAESNYACMWYLRRVLMSGGNLPLASNEDGVNDVVYGKINGIGHIVHVKELGEEV